MFSAFKYKITALSFCLCLVLSGCKQVSEEPPYSASSAEVGFSTSKTSVTEASNVTSVPEQTTTYICETAASQEDITEQTSTASTSQTSSEASETEGTTSETASEETTTTTETTTVPETAAVETTTAETTTVTKAQTTLQTESPSEFTSLQTEPVTVTKRPTYGTNTYSALNYREQKGIWISYLEYDIIMKNKTASSFKKSIGKYFDNIKSIGFNTVYVQVRAHGDAYYDSELFPSGDRFNGTMGTSENFDALQIMVDEAHERGLSVHAWINPMRLMTDEQIKNISDKYLIKQWYNDSAKNGTYIVKHSGRWYLNPAYKAVRELIADGISEILASYDVDGIQIDDYFYPTTAASFDKQAFSASGSSSLSAWRIKNVNSMVKLLYNTVHIANPTAVFGISPQGSIENNYDSLYADVETWCGGDYCDYILPQVYFGFDNASLPYEQTINEWNDMITDSSVKLVIGLAGYKVGAVDTYAGASGKNEWLNNTDILARQMVLASELEHYGGSAIFRYASLFEPSSSAAKYVSAELDEIKLIKN